MEIETGQDWDYGAAAKPGLPFAAPSGVSGFLAWLMIWLRVCTAQSWRRSQGRSGHVAARGWQPNRHRRRMDCAKIPPARTYGPYTILARRNKTPGQYAEWLAQYSGCGRVSVYRMRYWRKTVKGKAAPLGTEHEYWCDPLGHIGRRMARLMCGIWQAHLWPGWWGLYFFKPQTQLPKNIIPAQAGTFRRWNHIS